MRYLRDTRKIIWRKQIDFDKDCYFLQYDYVEPSLAQKAQLHDKCYPTPKSQIKTLIKYSH